MGALFRSLLASLAVSALLSGLAVAADGGAVSLRIPGAVTPFNLYTRSYALVIGMDDYSAGWPKLRNAVKDAEEVAKALEAQGFSVRLERNLKAADLELTFKEFFNFAGLDAAGDDIRLLVWFAGHGHSIERHGGGPLSGYIVGTDAPSPRTSDPATRRQAEAEFKNHAISLIRFGEHMRETFAKHVLVVFDSCFSGNLFQIVRAGGVPPAISRATTLPVRQFITSGDMGQFVSDDGMFRRLFINAISGQEPAADQDNDGYVTASELGNFLHLKVTNLTRNKQTPLFGTLREEGLDRGDFVFELPETMRTAAAALETAPLAEEKFWLFVKAQNDAKLIEAYLKSFPSSSYRVAAEQHMKALRGEPVELPFKTIPIFFGTDRAQEVESAEKGGKAGPAGKKTERLSFGADRARKLTLGRVSVTVPKARTAGVIERPWAIKIPYFQVTLNEQSENPEVHFTLQQIETKPQTEFTRSVGERAGAGGDGADAALVYVHGYNVSFDNAMFRAAQLASDMQIEGPMAAYSWPSGSSVSSYTYDRESVAAATPYFMQFLEALGHETGVKKIHIIAHGMGANLVMDALKARASKPGEAEIAAIGQVIFAAPDTDRDSFVQACGRVRSIVEGVTLYASASDRSLQVSRNFFGGVPRSGEVPDSGPVVDDCVSTIDVTAASSDTAGVNHSAYAENNALLKDVAAILKSGERVPGKRWPELETVNTASGTYWRYPGARTSPPSPAPAP